jgi:hypothetical protein
MSTALAVVDDTTKAELAALAGVSTTGGSELATLRVNGRDMDKDGNEYPVGVFALYDGNDTIYGKLSKCKLLSSGYQVREWDDNNKKYAAETIFFFNGSEREPEDTSGGYRCGKMFSRDVKELDEVDDKSLIAEQRGKKFYRVVWGVASIKGTYQDGTKAEGKSIPFLMRCTGNAFMPMCEHLDSLGADIFNVETTFDIEKRAGAQSSYYVAVPSRGKDAALTQEELDTLRAIDEDRKSWNDDVMAKWRKKNGLNVTKVAEAAKVVDAVIIEPDMDDTIPF